MPIMFVVRCGGGWAMVCSDVWRRGSFPLRMEVGKLGTAPGGRIPVPQEPIRVYHRFVH